MKASPVSVQLIFARKWGLSSYERVCFLSLPRSGTQLIGNIFRQRYIRQLEIGELFESHHISSYMFDHNDYLFRINFERSPFPTGWKLWDRDSYRLDVLKRFNLEQQLSIKLFVFKHYDTQLFDRIVETFIDRKFSFVSLQRNVVDQLFSYIVADHWSKGLNNNVFPINRVVQGTSKVIITEGIDKMCRYMAESNMLFQDNIQRLKSKYNLTIPHVTYENIFEQCSTLLQFQAKNDGVKTLDDPKLHIENYEEIKTYINSLTAF